MATRRQEKIARAVRESVSQAISNHLSDPRIVGLVSVTRVEISADLRNADVYLSIFGTDEAGQNKTYQAIVHARNKVQILLGQDIKSRFCPVIRFHKDEKFKKTIETLNIIDRAIQEIDDNKQKPLQEIKGQ
jgi:ribosome-binding factor A